MRQGACPFPSRTACRIVRVVVVHLIDGTFELFRYFLSPAAAFDRSAPEELRAVRGVVASMLGMLEGGATNLGVATDHLIESFRNALWPGYKTGEGMDPLLYAQFQPLEDALTALGVVVWPMVEFEADDALAAAGSYLFQDLSSVPPHLAASWVREFLNQAAQERFWEEKTAVQLAQRLRATVGIMGAGLPEVRKSLDSWITWVK